MSKGLASDPLGRLGEAQFEQLCIAGGLTPNRISWDRTGWDFLVEFPFPDMSLPLDSRPSPHEVKVQVKTVGQKAGTFKIRLSAAERLAKYPQAAFICVLVTDRENKFQQLYVLHMAGDLLSRILKELRKCQAESSLQINRHHLTLSYAKYGSPVPVQGEDLLKQMEAAIGPDPSRYAAMKREQLAGLGFDAARFKGSFNVRAKNLSELADVMLGLKPAQAFDIVTDEIRWGIPLPIQPPVGQGEIRIKPQGQPGELIIRSRQDTLKLKVDVAMPVMPSAARKAWKALVSSSVIEMLLDFSTQTVDFSADSLDRALTVKEHRNVIAWTRLVTSDAGVGIEVRIKHKLFFAGHFASTAGEYDTKNVHQMEVFLRGLNRLLGHAGALEIRFSREEMGPQVQTISLMSYLCLLAGRDQRLSFTATIVQPLTLSPEPSEILMLGFIRLGGVEIGLAAVGSAIITGDLHNKVIEVTKIGVREIERLSEGVSEFSERMRAETGLSLVLEMGKPDL